MSHQNQSDSNHFSKILELQYVIGGYFDGYSRLILEGNNISVFQSGSPSISEVKILLKQKYTEAFLDRIEYHKEQNNENCMLRTIRENATKMAFNWRHEYPTDTPIESIRDDIIEMWRRNFVVTYNPSDEEWMEFSKSLEQLKVWDWKQIYVDSDILDGTQWSLRIRTTSSEIVCYGSNAYPTNYNKFITSINKLTDDAIMRSRNKRPNINQGDFEWI